MEKSDGAMALLVQGAALVSLGWSCLLFVVQLIGIYKLFRYHSAPNPKPVSPSLPKDEVPHITIIRPVKGVEVGLYECLASTLRLDYPRTKISVRLCVSSADDPAYPILCQLVADFPDIDVKVLVEEDDPLLHGAHGRADNLGPNPKIRNISRAYREAKGDVIWVVDCNVWVAKRSAGRLVDKLFGFLPNGERATPYKFVHQIPLVVDLDDDESSDNNNNTRRSGSAAREEQQSLLPVGPRQQHAHARGSKPRRLLDYGGRLEEMFMSTTHAKFYGAINTVSIAPCIVGKSNMFRKSQLDALTDPALNPTILSPTDAARGRGVDFFSSYICEDHLIGDLFFRSPIPGHKNHGLVFGEVAVQPTAGMTVAAYVARRVRWLRVRKWTVLAATLVEPNVESLVCSAHFAFALTTLPWLGFPATYTAMAAIWLFGVATWMLVDWTLSAKLRQMLSVEADEDTPSFARGSSRQGGIRPRSFAEWLPAWLGRELLALPIWTWAVLLGATVTWRGKKFRVSMDMTVQEIGGGADACRMPSRPATGTDTPRSRSKDRLD